MPDVNISRLRIFVQNLADLLAVTQDEAQIIDKGGDLLRKLVAQDDWLPDAYARPNPDCYQQYLLHCDSRQLFSVVSFVWGAGQATPVHDHTVWGLIGVLRGAEIAQPYGLDSAGRLTETGPAHRLEAGQVDAVSPRIGDIHRVSNAFADRTSISIHVYGANIGAVRRAVYNPAGGKKEFVSGYSSEQIPNLWDLSAQQGGRP